MRPLWQLRVSPPARQERTASGIFIPPSDYYSLTERESEHESRPESGVVIGVPENGFMVLGPGDRSAYLADGMGSGYIDSKGIPQPSPQYIHHVEDWRLPSIGDAVWFGYQSWRWPREDAFMWPSEIHCVVPADGSPPWAMGDWCLVEQVREKSVTDSGIIVSSNPGHDLARGVVRMIGDGFSKAKPNISVGDLVVFQVYRDQNPECPNPVGSWAMTRLKPSMVVAIDKRGITDGELSIRESAAAAVSSIAPAYVKALDMESGKKEERWSDLERKSKKEMHRLYHGKRNTY